MRIDLPKNVENIIEKLEENGFEGFAVGGCVRDSMLHRKPKDWDITTNALPEEMKKIFKKTFDTGIAHGTITVLMDGVGYELTTYRIDGNYSDGRHPDSVSFSKSLSIFRTQRNYHTFPLHLLFPGILPFHYSDIKVIRIFSFYLI